MPKPVRVCFSCQKVRRKCVPTQTGSCERCTRMNKPCEYNDPAPVVLRWKACVRCHNSHVKCKPGADGNPCERCLRLDASCVYINGDVAEPASLRSGSNTSDSNSKSPMSCIGSPLYLYMNAMDVPLVEYESGGMDTEDPDLIPTLEDWTLVYNFFTKHGTVLPQAAGFDAENMLHTYFHKPAGLRLILCGWSFITDEGRNLDVASVYFKRARKALNCMDLTPSVDLLITNNLICSFAAELGDGYQHLEETFALKCMDVALDLRMNIDPDHSPWLSHLTARQKEERRRIFWFSFRAYSIVQALSPTSLLPTAVDGMKYPRQIYDPNPIFLNIMHPLRLKLWNLIGVIKQYWTVPPNSLHELFSSVLSSHLLDQLTSLQKSTPIDHLLFFDHPQIISPPDIKRFITQTLATRADLCAMNLTYHSTGCVFFRPIMFTTALASCHPDQIDQVYKTLIIEVINKCIESAWRIFTLFRFSFYMNYGDGKSLVDSNDLSLFDTDAMTTYDAFEGLICLWFVACRMDNAWVSYLKYGDCNSKELRGSVGFMLASYAHEARRNVSNLGITKAMAGMLEEMEEVANTGVRHGFESISGFREADLGLANMSSPKSSTPRCFMSLLGMDVSNKVGWKGRTEESWKLFWKLND